MSEHVAYFSEWRARPYTCECGWSGPSKELDTEFFDELAQYSCPKCDRHLVVVGYPTGDDVREAAERGNEEAKRMLPQVIACEAREALEEERRERWQREAVRKASDLPELEGDAMAFTWDLGEVDGLSYVLISLGSTVVCREPASTGASRFPEVKAIFKERYGARFRRLDITEAAKDYLLDEDSSSSSVEADFDPT